jgi:hypothetical protein
MEKLRNQFITPRRRPRPMDSDSEAKQRYSYKFKFQAKEPDADKSREPSKEEIQAFVNEILGITKDRKLRQEATVV